MILYIVQRLALLPLLMLIYSFVIFAIIQAPPGDFLSAYVATLASSGSSISADQIAALRHQYGLDQPFVVQYFLWMQNLFHGDFGLSLEYQRPNADLIGEQIGLTIALALFSFVLTWAISVPAGIYSATHPRSLGDHVLTVVHYARVATPNSMLALILVNGMNLANIGPLLLRALINQDMYLAGGILLIYSFLTIVGTLLSDVLLALIDPRIRVEK